MLPRKARWPAEILLQGGRLMAGMTFGTPLETGLVAALFGLRVRPIQVRDFPPGLPGDDTKRHLLPPFRHRVEHRQADIKSQVPVSSAVHGERPGKRLAK